MRIVAAFAVMVFMAALPSLASAASCPKDATRASLAVWPPNSISTGASVTAAHPCGRTITCTGGQSNKLRTRYCRWQ